MGIKWIAEAGSNHNQDIFRGVGLISHAASIGCWGVKFQYYKADMLWSDQEKADAARPGEIELEWLKTFKNHARKRGIKLGCSVYHPSHVEEVAQHVDFLKISSFEANNEELVKKCLDTKKLLFVSHGIEVADCIWSAEIKHLHCVSRYPVKPDECDMPAMLDMDGWSDHSHNWGVILAAVSNSAEYIEFHLDLADEAGYETKHGHCWTANEIGSVMKIARDMQSANTINNHNRTDLVDLMWKPELDAR